MSCQLPLVLSTPTHRHTHVHTRTQTHTLTLTCSHTLTQAHTHTLTRAHPHPTPRGRRQAQAVTQCGRCWQEQLWQRAGGHHGHRHTLTPGRPNFSARGRCGYSQTQRHSCTRPGSVAVTQLLPHRAALPACPAPPPDSCFLPASPPLPLSPPRNQTYQSPEDRKEEAETGRQLSDQ